ncbi:MAG: type II secretion system protein [Phycisphaeraceae bacterium]
MPRSRRSGYTLIEVLTAMTIIALVLPVAMQGITLATSLGGQTRRRSEAATLARLKLDELAATGAWQSGSLNGDFAPDWSDYQWSATVVDWDTAGLRQLDVQVTWAGRGNTQSIQMSTLVNTETP